MSETESLPARMAEETIGKSNIVLIIRSMAPYWIEAIESLAQAWQTRGEIYVITEGTGEDPLHPWDLSEVQLKYAHLRIIAAERRRWLNTPWPRREMWRTLETIDPSLIIIHEYSPYVVLSGLMWAKAAQRPCVVATDVGPVQRRQLSYVQRMIHAIVNAAVEGVLARTQDAMDQGRITLQASLFSPHAIDTNFYNVRPSRAHEKVRFIQVGSLIPRKGVDLLLRAFQRARQNRSDIELILVGSGDHETAMQLASELGVQNSVTIIDFLQPTELARKYSECDIFVLASRFDSYGVVVHEAAAAGLPLVVSKFAGASATLVENGVNGFQIDPNDIEEFAEALLCTADPAINVRFSAASRRIAQKYDVTAVAQRTASWLAQILAAFPRPSRPARIASPLAGVARLAGAVLRNEFRFLENALFSDPLNSSKRDVVYVGRYIPFYREAIFRRIADWCKLRLLYSGKTIGNLRSIESLDIAAVRSWEASRGGISQIMWVSCLLQLLIARPKIVCTEFSLSLLSTWILFAFRPLLRFRIVFWGHGFQHYGWKERRLDLADRIRAWWIRWCDAYIFYSADRKNDVVEVMGRNPKFFVAPNSQDTTHLATIYSSLQKEGRENIKHRLGISRPSLVFLGRLSRDKEVLRLPEILALTARAQNPPDLIIIGGGECEFELKRLCDPYLKRVKFLGPVFDVFRRSEYLYSADLMISPGYVGLNVVDSLAVGCPVATVDDSLLPKRHSPEITYVRPGRNALVAGNLEALANDIVRFIDTGRGIALTREALQREFLNECSIDSQFDGIRSALIYAANH